MFLNKVELHNIRNFKGTHTFEFTKINIIEGENGAGKTTLGLDSILFSLYGHCSQKLEEFITKGEKLGSATLNFSGLTVKRSFPTKVELSTSEEFTTNKEKQNYLNNQFKNLEYFKKFRMLDVIQGINILEGGKTALLKTLVGLSEELFSDVKTKLLDKKKEREIYNKDKAVIYTHFPSEDRLDFINMKILELSERLYSLDKDVSEAQSEYNDTDKKKSAKTALSSHHKKEKELIMSKSECPTCLS